MGESSQDGRNEMIIGFRFNLNRNLSLYELTLILILPELMEN